MIVSNENIIAIMTIDSPQINSVRIAGLTMYDILSLRTQKSVRCLY